MKKSFIFLFFPIPPGPFFFFFNFIGVMTTQVSHLKELTKIHLNRMPFKLFLKKQFSTVDLETNKSVLASTISDEFNLSQIT